MIRCDVPGCVRGIVHRPGGFGDPCKVCGGKGTLPLARVCSLLSENRSTVVKLLKPRRRLRPKTAARLLDKIIALVEAPQSAQASAEPSRPASPLLERAEEDGGRPTRDTTPPSGSAPASSEPSPT